MVPLCRGSAAPAVVAHRVSNVRARRTRVRRAVLTALLFGLIFLPIFLEVAKAFEGTPDETGALLTSRKTLDFGSRPVGGTTPHVSLAIANNSGSQVSISKVTIDGPDAGDFALVSSTCETLAADAVCTLVTRFTPKAAGARSARLVVSGGTADRLEVPLVGKGVDPAERRSRRTARPYR